MVSKFLGLQNVVFDIKIGHLTLHFDYLKYKMIRAS
jgi:hypothetical protein